MCRQRTPGRLASSDVNGARSPKDGRCMSDFGVRKDVQQTHVIAVVVINVLLGSANNGLTAMQLLGLRAQPAGGGGKTPLHPIKRTNSLK